LALGLQKQKLNKEALMNLRKLGLNATLFLIVFGLLIGPAFAAGPSLDAWKPAFDPAGAKYKFIVSNVSHPVLKGVYTGFAIRDELWKRTNGQMYLDYKPFSMLGGEVEVLNQLQMGAIQGMAVSSVASTNLGPRFGIVNLPFLVDSFEKLEKFVNSGKLFDHFLMAMDHQGIMAVDIASYGNYGWATTVPVKTIADAKQVKFRIAEAAVNQLSYKAWGFNPVVMPWPDVPVALKQGVITGLDHTLTVCSITKKFEVRYAALPRNSKWPNILPSLITPRVFLSGLSTRPGLISCRKIFRRRWLRRFATCVPRRAWLPNSRKWSSAKPPWERGLNSFNCPAKRWVFLKIRPVRYIKNLRLK
jgi:TRAP-type C4-dicarboxylate transport system substrate-binding protein